jgi:hypothetical protein
LGSAELGIYHTINGGDDDVAVSIGVGVGL